MKRAMTFALLLVSALMWSGAGQTAVVNSEATQTELKITSGQCSADELIGSAPRPDEMVNCRACRNKSYGMPVTSGINFVATLPYVNRNFESQTHDLGYYDILDGTLENPYQKISRADHFITPPAKTHLGNYAQALGIYVAIWVLILVLFVTCSVFALGVTFVVAAAKGGAVEKRIQRARSTATSIEIVPSPAC